MALVENLLLTADSSRASQNLLYQWGIDGAGNLALGGQKTPATKLGVVEKLPESWSIISSGNNHVAAIRSDGALFTWGNNTNGQLGDGTTIAKSSPTQIGFSSWTAVSAGHEFTAAIRSGGTLFTWGSNLNGRLGANTATGTANSSPVQIGSSSWTVVTAGRYHAAAIRSGGTLFTWGLNSSGQLGNGNTNANSSPVQIGSSSWTAVSAGANHTAAVRSGGTLFTWGLNSYGQLGNGNTNANSSPVQIGSSSWTAVSAGTYNTEAIYFTPSDVLTGGNTLFSWGKNDFGQLGLKDSGTATNRSSPTIIYDPNLGQSWKMITVSEDGSSAAAIRSDGLLFTWGLNSSGQLGNGTITNRSSPVQIGSSSWTTVSAGKSHIAAIRSGGTLFTWGLNSSGQLGDGTTTNRSSPVQVGNFWWTSVDAGEIHTAAIRSDGLLFTWGDNTNGQLGDITTTVKSSPVQIGSSSWTAVSAGGRNTAAIRSDGLLFTWGLNSSGQLGDGTTTTNSSPVQIGSSSWTVVSTGGAHIAAIRSGGTLFTWGSNSGGQLGLNQSVSISNSSPVQVGSSSWIAVSAGANNTSGILSNNQAYEWGNNNFGQIGDKTTTPKSSPVLLSNSTAGVTGNSWTMVAASYMSGGIRNDGIIFTWGNNSVGQLGQNMHSNVVQIAEPRNVGDAFAAKKWNQVSAGATHTLAIRSDGMLFTWGNNLYGMLGSGDGSVNISSPIQIGTSSWTVVSAGRAFHSGAIRSDGALFMWGRNGSGELGDGTNTGKSSPVQIGSSSWTAVGTGANHTAAIRSGGTLFTWGLNSSGQLGNGNTNANSSPVQIGSSSWTAVSAGANHTAAIRSGGTLFTWGSNSNGQLGANTATGTANSSPVQIGSSSWTVVGAGGVFTTAIRSGGTLFSTGYNPGGTQTSSPVQLGSSSWTAVSGGNAHVLAIRSDNALFAWGFNGNGQTGGGSGASPTTQIFGSGGESLFTNISAGVSFSTAIRSGGTLFTCGGAQGNSEDMLGRKMHEKNPVSITPDKSWAVLSCGTLNASSGAIRSDGLLFTWGPSFYGSIADGTNTGKSSPVQIGSSSWTAVSMRSATNAAIRSDGTLFTWGFNSNGQVGDGTTTVKSSPVQIGSSSWTAVSCGSSHIAAIRSGGTLFTWGSNSNGQLGLNQSTTISNSSPVQVGSSSWTAVSAGDTFTLAIRSDGLLFSWGSNGNGELGLNQPTTISNSSPVQVGSSSWIAISAGKNGALAIRSDRMLFAWGFGYNGQIGDGTNTTKSSPVQIGSSLWTAIRAGTGNETSMGLTVANTLFAWGSNGYGQIGDGTDTRRLSPVQIGAAGAWAALGGTGQMSGAIRKT